MAGPDAGDALAALATHTVSHAKLTGAELAAEVAKLGPRWSVDGTGAAAELRCQLDVKPMARAAAAAAHAAQIADAMDHHPTITLAYAGLKLAINTHDAGALTTLDVVFAARLEQWLRANGY
jgi:4a-hydroxytetrahydrobiopterin dehydratase